MNPFRTEPHRLPNYLRAAALLAVLTIGAMPILGAEIGRAKLAGQQAVQSTISHYIWTSKQAYSPGEQQTLYWTFDPMDDPYPYTLFVYLEKVDTGERQYLNVNGGTLQSEAIDVVGNSAGNFLVQRWPAVTKSQLVSGPVPSEPGLWHWVAEVRDHTGTQLIHCAWAKFVVYDNEQFFQNPPEGQEGIFITEDTTWVQTTVYRLRTKVFVEDGATLTVEPGTHILGLGSESLLVVKPGGKIIADGTKSSPIVMGCDLPIEQREPSCWSGFIVLGRAITNTLTGTGIAEGITEANGTYGGNDPADSSGVLRYLRVEFAGFRETTLIEPNAYGLHAIGSGTIIDHIQAHWGKDDGVEFFGGSANARYVVISGANDDSLDWTDGWNGKVQFLYVMQDDTVECDEGNEADNNGDGNDFEPRSMPHIWNATVVGAPLCEGRGLLLKEGTGAVYKNLIVMNSPGPGLEIDDPATCSQSMNGGIVFDGATFWANNGGDTTFDGQFGINETCDSLAYIRTQNHILVQNPNLIRPGPSSDPLPLPKDESHVSLIGYSVRPPDDGFCDTAATYHGAFGPKMHQNWLYEWTNFIRPSDVQ